MPDDVSITPGTGAIIATDELTGGRHVQIMKPAFGTDGLATMVSPADPLPVESLLSRPVVARLSSAPINLATLGDNVLLAGTALQTIRVFQFWLVSNGAVSIKWRSGAVDFHPPIAMVAGGSWVFEFSGEPWFVTAAGADLILNLSAAVQISGRFYYTKG